MCVHELVWAAARCRHSCVSHLTSHVNGGRASEVVLNSTIGCCGRGCTRGAACVEVILTSTRIAGMLPCEGEWVHVHRILRLALTSGKVGTHGTAGAPQPPRSFLELTRFTDAKRATPAFFFLVIWDTGGCHSLASLQVHTHARGQIRGASCSGNWARSTITSVGFARVCNRAHFHLAARTSRFGSLHRRHCS